MNIPLTANRTGETSMIRVRSTASDVSCACCPVSSPSPGAVIGTSHGASSSPTNAATSVARNTRFSTDDARRHASRSPRALITRANVGMNALPSVAPASSWNTRSGMRNATKYASRFGLVPNWCAIATVRTSPSSLLPRNPRATTEAAIARLGGATIGASIAVSSSAKKRARNVRNIDDSLASDIDGVRAAAAPYYRSPPCGESAPLDRLPTHR